MPWRLELTGNTNTQNEITRPLDSLHHQQTPVAGATYINDSRHTTPSSPMLLSECSGRSSRLSSLSPNPGLRPSAFTSDLGSWCAGEPQPMYYCPCLHMLGWISPNISISSPIIITINQPRYQYQNRGVVIYMRFTHPPYSKENSIYYLGDTVPW